MLIPVQTARQLLDFQSPTAAIIPQVAEAQLGGAVALHNVFETLAYFADEVGVGKTYVTSVRRRPSATKTAAFRVLFIAPRTSPPEAGQQACLREVTREDRIHEGPSRRCGRTNGAPPRFPTRRKTP